MFCVALLIFITGFHFGITKGIDQGEKNLHIDNTNMNENLREAFLREHNNRRRKLLNGNPFPGEPARRLPKAEKMPLLTYDYELEKSAYEIAKQCDNFGLSLNRFDYVGSNNYTLENGAFDKSSIKEAVLVWWNTGLTGNPLVDLAPQANDFEKIPFLQIANANTTTLGCSFYECELYDYTYFSVTCRYGKPNIELGVPIYEEKKPCKKGTK